MTRINISKSLSGGSQQLNFDAPEIMHSNPISPKNSKPAITLGMVLASGLLLLLTHTGRAQSASTFQQREQNSCPNLAPYYPLAFFENKPDLKSRANGSVYSQHTLTGSALIAVDDNPVSVSDWLLLVDELTAIQSLCLRSSEYYALIGGAQLHAAQIGKSYESLERALLLDPNNGAAQLDYSFVLYDMGQRYAALEINQTLLARNDLPEHLRKLTELRKAEWLRAAKEHTVKIGASQGYDNNLNGAPDIGQLTLTLSGAPVSFNLSSDMTAQSGAFSNLRLTSTQRTSTESGQRSWMNELRGRVSNNSDSDLFQLDSQYSIVDITRKKAMLWEGGVTSLNFGGNTLYSAAQARFRYQLNSKQSCSPTAEIATQLQYFHMQPTLNGLETRVAAGVSCAKSKRINYGMDIAHITNKAFKSQRPGKDRSGQMATFRYQRQIGKGDFYAQTSFANFKDDAGYSSLISNGDRRWQDRWSAVLQYRAPLITKGGRVEWVINASHQDQRSNIELFRQDNKIIELGISVLL